MSTRRVVRVGFRCVVLFTCLTVGACRRADTTASSGTAVTVDTLPNGAIAVSYPEIPREPAVRLDADLHLGASTDLEFGDIRGIAVDLDGSILVLDHQASELRRFSATGEELEVVATEGDGPHEIRAANGVRVGDDGSYWINDHGKSRLTRLLPDGEVETLEFFVRGFQYFWDGAVTTDGRVWSAWSHTDRPLGPREPGIVEGVSRSYYKRIDPVSGLVDSVPIIQRLAADDEGNVWVQRESEPGPALEQFSSRGKFLRRVDLEYPVFRYYQPVFQRGWSFTVQTDSFDVQSVIGSRIPGSP